MNRYAEIQKDTSDVPDAGKNHKEIGPILVDFSEVRVIINIQKG